MRGKKDFLLLLLLLLLLSLPLLALLLFLLFNIVLAVVIGATTDIAVAVVTAATFDIAVLSLLLLLLFFLICPGSEYSISACCFHHLHLPLAQIEHLDCEPLQRPLNLLQLVLEGFHRVDEIVHLAQHPGNGE